MGAHEEGKVSKPKKSNLSPRGDGPFRVLEKINNNAYKLELPGELNISPTFNITDLVPYYADESILRSEPCREGGDDEDIESISNLSEPDEETISNIPTMRSAPRTRSRTRALREEFKKQMESLITLINEHGEFQEDQTIKANKDYIQDQFNTPTNLFLPLLQGVNEANLFIITKDKSATTLIQGE